MKNKKILLGIGTLSAIAAPIAAVVACGSEENGSIGNYNKPQMDSYKTATVQAYRDGVIASFNNLTTDGTTPVDTSSIASQTTVEGITKAAHVLNINLKTTSNSTHVNLTIPRVPENDKMSPATLNTYKTTLVNLFKDTVIRREATQTGGITGTVDEMFTKASTLADTVIPSSSKPTIPAKPSMDAYIKGKNVTFSEYKDKIIGYIATGTPSYVNISGKNVLGDFTFKVTTTSVAAAVKTQFITEFNNADTIEKLFVLVGRIDSNPAFADIKSNYTTILNDLPKPAYDTYDQATENKYRDDLKAVFNGKFSAEIKADTQFITNSYDAHEANNKAKLLNKDFTSDSGDNNSSIVVPDYQNDLLSQNALDLYKHNLEVLLFGLYTSKGSTTPVDTITIANATTADEAYKAISALASAGLFTSGVSTDTSAKLPKQPAKDSYSDTTIENYKQDMVAFLISKGVKNVPNIKAATTVDQVYTLVEFAIHELNS